MDIQQGSRRRAIVRVSMLGIGVNLLLAVFKAVVGILAHSIAIVLDAVNNLSDVLSSTVTIAGAHLAGKEPDKEHPLGHGRAEYISSMVVVAIVLYAGIAALVESVKKILHPELPRYTAVTLIVVAAAVVVKLALGRFVKYRGRKLGSPALEASGADALYDAVISASVLISAGIFLIWGVSLEAWVGAAIGLFIIWSGYRMLRDTLDDLLGHRIDRELTAEIKKTICAEECVSGAFDLILHSYGPETYIGSVHVEVPEDMPAKDIVAMERRIARAVLEKHGVILAAVGVYSRNTGEDGSDRLWYEVMRRVMAHDGVRQVHGFYADMERKTMDLDIILDFDLPDREAAFRDICAELRETYPEYTVNATMDLDI